ncbi:MAG: MFS transporter, partial [Acidimicrobiales bacterium]
RTVDIPGVILSAAGLTTLALALIQGATWGWTSTKILALFAAAVVSFVAFAIVELRSANPLIDFGFFRRRNFTGAVLALFVIDFSFGALLFFLPSYFQEILDYSAVKAGVLLLPMTALMVVASVVGGRVAAKGDARTPIAIGLFLMGVGTFWISTMTTDTTFSTLWLPTLVAGWGVGFAITPLNLAAINSVSKEHTGSASGILVTLSGLGSTLGVAVTGGLFQQLLLNRTVSYAHDAGITITKAQASNLDGVLSGAPTGTATLQQVAGANSAALENAFREAYVSALGTSLKIAAVLLAAGIVVTIALMRKAAPADTGPTTPVPAPPTRPAPRLPRPAPAAAGGPVGYSPD